MKNYEKDKKKKKKVIALLATLAVMVVVAGTFAWTSYTKWIKNHMQSRGFETGEVSIVEKFPNPEIKPGEEVKKEVSINNASDSSVFVRVSFEEMLHKLKNNAHAKDYPDLISSGFPVVVDASEYKVAGSQWRDATAELRINGDKQVPPANGDVGYKLYENNGQTFITYVKKTIKSYFPTNFEFANPKTAVTVFSGTFANDDAQVAQKITGTPTKQADNSYDFKTQDKSGDLKYYGYGEELDVKIEKNWAGSSIKLSDKGLVATPSSDPNKSVVDSTIIFSMSNVGVDANDIGAKDWYYNNKDGYYYYTRKLLASTQTNSTVLESIKIPMDETYGISSYDLWVGMEAIPSYLASMQAKVDDSQDGKGAGGWGLVKTDEMYKYFAGLADAE